MSFRNIPGLPPPDGIESNFVNPPNRNAEAMAGIIICIILTSSAVLIRAYSRIFCMKMVRIQDILALLAFGTYLACVYILFWFKNLTGYYVHQWDVPAVNLPTFLHIIYLGMVLYELTMLNLKISILTEWIRLFVPHGTKNAFYWTCLAVLIVNVMYYMASIFSVSFSCNPRAQLCHKSSVVFICSGVINLISDVIILILPIKTIWNLQLSKKKKMSISVVFAIGFFCCVAAVVRLATAINAYISEDKTYTLSTVVLWVFTEATCAFLVFCIPTAPKAFKGSKLAKLLFGSSADASQSKNVSGGQGSRTWQRNGRMELSPSGKGYINKGVQLQSLHSIKGGASESSEQLHVAAGDRV
ncbi:uncharacterized protein F4822DRAFT_64765 [Hypoxylon trugodes]|uniref:uncharacterized protein n=1 Tax=Hypoxylon trugodes TaxID=326681 RepID=UPI00219B1329|nr:uncharacterized protein F4822DRAFT_64765 [Hypoxylon trugodes]KAI1384257.1 hypothetical protein F4822DRAFT_64765 [Hypoxylon trugodes]